ncbi:unnamed protein product, partial [Meganyctiphanes norvegica]
CKPEQVQARLDNEGPPSTHLVYTVGDVITVLDKKPVADRPCLWKGVMNNGRTGLFNPANTVTYQGTNDPSNKSNFKRDDKNAYSLRRGLSSAMISGPQGDLKHIAHVGIDGYFGDVSFLGDELQQVKVYLILFSIEIGVSDHNLSRSASEDHTDNWSADSPACSHKQDHEHHEISDEKEEIKYKSEDFQSSSFDLGPPLMDEVYAALGGSPSLGPSSLNPSSASPSPLTPTQQQQTTAALIQDNDTHNQRNECKEMASKFTKEKKKQAMGDVLKTRGGGAQVVLQDMEVVKTRNVLDPRGHKRPSGGTPVVDRNILQERCSEGVSSSATQIHGTIPSHIKRARF